MEARKRKSNVRRGVASGPGGSDYQRSRGGTTGGASDYIRCKSTQIRKIGAVISLLERGSDLAYEVKWTSFNICEKQAIFFLFQATPYLGDHCCHTFHGPAICLCGVLCCLEPPTRQTRTSRAERAYNFENSKIGTFGSTKSCPTFRRYAYKTLEKQTSRISLN